MKIIVVITLVILLYLSKWLYNIITSEQQKVKKVKKEEEDTKKEYYIYWNGKTKNGTLYKTIYNTHKNALKELERLRHYHRNYGLDKTVDLWIE